MRGQHACRHDWEVAGKVLLTNPTRSMRVLAADGPSRSCACWLCLARHRRCSRKKSACTQSGKHLKSLTLPLVCICCTLVSLLSAAPTKHRSGPRDKSKAFRRGLTLLSESSSSARRLPLNANAQMACLITVLFHPLRTRCQCALVLVKGQG